MLSEDSTIFPLCATKYQGFWVTTERQLFCGVKAPMILNSAGQFGLNRIGLVKYILDGCGDEPSSGRSPSATSGAPPQPSAAASLGLFAHRNNTAPAVILSADMNERVIVITPLRSLAKSQLRGSTAVMIETCSRRAGGGLAPRPAPLSLAFGCVCARFCALLHSFYTFVIVPFKR